MNATDVPPLEPHCGSWIATASRGRIVEVWTIDDARKLLALGWTVKTAARHLADLNAKTPRPVATIRHDDNGISLLLADRTIGCQNKTQAQRYAASIGYRTSYVDVRTPKLRCRAFVTHP